MNANLEKPKRVVPVRKHLSNLWARMRAFFKRQPLLKITSLVLGLLLWAVLISQDPELTRQRVFNNVKVNITGADTLRSNGYVMTTVFDTPPTVSFEIEVPQLNYNAVSETNFTVRMDLSGITSAGKQRVPITISGIGTSRYGTPYNISPAYIEVQISEYVTRSRVPVNTDIIGTTPEGYWTKDKVTPDPVSLDISGPKEILDTIARVVAPVDLSRFQPAYMTDRISTNIYVVDQDNNVIDSSLLRITRDGVVQNSVVVEQTFYPTREYQLTAAGALIGTPAAGYEIKSVVFEPEMVMAAGALEALRLIDYLFYDNPISLEGVTASFKETLRITKPADIQFISSEVISVKVVVGPQIIERSFQQQPLQVENTPSNCKAQVGVTRVNVTLTGEKLWLRDIRASKVIPYVNLANLGPGEYELPVYVRVEGSEGVEYTVRTDIQTVRVVITAK